MKHNQPTKKINEQNTIVHELEKELFPFKVLEKNEKFKIIIGDSFASEEEFKSLLDAKNYISQKPYDLLITLIGLTIEMQKKYEKESKELTKRRKSTKSNS